MNFRSLILFATLGFALLVVISTAAFFNPAQVPESDTGTPVGIVETLTVFPEAVVPETVDMEFTLKTVGKAGKLAYIGVDGEIDGVINPDLVVHPGDTVRLILVNGDGMPHDLFLPDFNAGTEYVYKINDRIEIIFEVGEKLPGAYVYYCTVMGHRQAGQEGKLIISAP